MIHALLLLLHLLAATVWVGGMVAFHFAVRPAAVATLEPPARLAFLATALGRFFALVTLAIIVLFGSGAALIVLAGGFAALPWGVHAMVALALPMVALFAWIRLRCHVALRAALAAAQMPAAAAALATIRRLVLVNLVLGVAVYAVALLGRGG